MKQKSLIATELFKKTVTVKDGKILFIDAKGKTTALTSTQKSKLEKAYNDWVLENEPKLKAQAIETFVYSKYTAVKQSQDEKWVSNYTTKLKAQSVENLELQVVQMITSFYQGKTLAEALAPVTDEEQKPYFEKLVKVGIRTEWMENCIKEGNLAISENREPVYPEFPQIN